MVQFFVTLAETVRFEDEACWALTLPSAAIDTTAKPARTIKLRRIPTSNCTRFWVSSETPSNRAGCGADAASAQRVYPHELGFGDDTQWPRRSHLRRSQSRLGRFHRAPGWRGAGQEHFLLPTAAMLGRREFLELGLAGAIAGGIDKGRTPAEELPKRELGRTGERVSMVGLGGAHIGRVKDEAESLRIVRA